MYPERVTAYLSQAVRQLIMAVTQDTIVINEGFESRQRTTSNGTKTRYTLTVKAEPVMFNLSAVALGAGPAEAIRNAIVNGIKAIGVMASPATLLKRKYAESAFNRGAKWANKRYTGGKTGATVPAQSDRLFNDSGRLANGIFVRQNTGEKGWTINVPANRLDPSTFKMDAFIRMVDRLRELVPVIRNPFQDPAVVNAITSSVENVLIQKHALTSKKASELRWKLFKQITSLASQVSNLGG